MLYFNLIATLQHLKQRYSNIGQKRVTNDVDGGGRGEGD